MDQKPHKIIDVMQYTMDSIIESLEALQELELQHPLTGYEKGQKEAYVLALEMLLLWDDAAKYGYTFEPETEFPLSG